MNADFKIKTFGELTNTSRVTIWRMIKRGDLHAYKVMNCVRIPFTELDRIRQLNKINQTDTNQPKVGAP